MDFSLICHRLLLDNMSSDVEPSRNFWVTLFYLVCVRVLFDADDRNLFLPEIQSDLNKLYEWLKSSALELNVGTCKSNTF
jgi:hypothetical protein